MTKGACSTRPVLAPVMWTIKGLRGFELLKAAVAGLFAYFLANRGLVGF